MKDAEAGMNRKEAVLEAYVRGIETGKANALLIAAATALADTLEDAARSAAHEEACAWWEANISELRTEAQIAANDAKCDCWIGKARTALRLAGRLP